MLKLTLDNVKKFLKEKNYEIQYQKETDQLFMVQKIEGHDFPLFIRVYDEGDLLQIILFIPITIKNGAQADVARLLHTLNKEIDIPGFGMDETTNVVFYRIMIPSYNKEIEEELISMFMETLPVVAQSFAPIIFAAAVGSATYEEIMKKIKEGEKSS